MFERLLSASSPRQRLELKKQVRFGSDVKVRVRPSDSNLRPLSRLARKEQSAGSDPFVKALDNWDLDWRLYLKQYYDENMQLVLFFTAISAGYNEVSPRLATSPSMMIHQYVLVRRKLSSLAEDCKRTHQTWLANLTVAEKKALDDLAHAPELRLQLKRLFAGRTHILQRLVVAVQSWEEMEKRRWATCEDGQPSADHETFCDFVERVDALQRKFKAISDSIRRVNRKSKKLKDALFQQNILKSTLPHNTLMLNPERTSKPPCLFAL